MNQDELIRKYNLLQSYNRDAIIYQENVALNYSQDPLELEEALKQNLELGNLKKHQLSEIYKEFNINITNVMMIYKFYFIKQKVKDLMKIQNQREIEKLQNNLKEQLLDNLSHLRTLQFQAVCLLDGVKLLLPVRFKGCGHLECYELLSLLMLIKTNQDGDDLKQFTWRRCLNTYDISTYEQLFKLIYIDKQLLKVINLSQPQILLYNYSFQDDSYSSNFKSGDEIISTFYSKYFKIKIQVLKTFRIIFQEIFIHARQIHSIQKKHLANQYKYNIKIIKLI